MAERLEQLLDAAAPAPRGEVDADEVWRSGRRRRTTRRAGVAVGALAAAAAVGGLLVVLPVGTADVEFAGPGPRVAAVEAAAAEGGVVAEREVDGIHARVVVEGDAVCVETAGPDEVDGSSCTPLDVLRSQLAVRGAKWVKTASPALEVFAGLVPDGYTEAVSADGRRWTVVDNLFVIVIDHTDTDAALPDWVDLYGPAGWRPLAIAADPPPPEGLLLDHRGFAPLLAEDVRGTMTPGVVFDAGMRVFVIERGGHVIGLVADAQHGDDEGLWWCPTEQAFVSPDSGALFDPAGRLVAGPARADLDRVAVTILDGGVLAADLAQTTPGQRRDGRGLGLAADIDPQVYDRYREWAAADRDGRSGFCADHQPPIDRPGSTLSEPSNDP